MVCIYCGNETQVVNSRHQKRANGVWRRRQCLTCKAIFTTVEASDLEKSVVVKEGATLSPFLRDKLFVSVYESLKHRKTALNDATALTDTVISNLLRQTKDGTIDKPLINQACADVLKKFDKTATTYYVAYHPLP